MIFALSILTSLSACDDKKQEATDNKDIAAETVEVEEEKNETTEKTIKEDNATDFSSIVEKDVENTISALKAEYEELVAEINTYDKYKNNIDKIEAYYVKITASTNELRIKLSEYAINYAQEIVSSDLSNDDKYEELDEIYDVIYEDARDEIYDEIYNGILDDMLDSFYNGILEYNNDISYDEWSDLNSDEYDRWSDTGSEVYDIWSDLGSDIYDFWSDVRGELWDDDLEKAQKKIDDFKEDTEKLKSGNAAEKSEDKSSDSNKDDNKENDDVNTSSDEIRPEFKETLDSYEKFFDEYCEFMKKYKESPNDLSLLEDYTEYMEQYSETMEKISELENEDMNDAELKYYIEVTNRIEEKMLDIAL